MKILKKVAPIEVKRCFVISDFISHQKYTRKQMANVSPAQYRKRVAHAKEVILELPEMMLDMILKGEWAKRYRTYQKMQWHIAEMGTDELGVWKGAGGLPVTWTKGSLKETAQYVKEALAHNPKQLKARSYTAIPGIIKTALKTVQTEKYLYPIALPGGTYGRSGFKKMKGDLDDGCMRSIALAVSGKKKIKVYLGKKKKK